MLAEAASRFFAASGVERFLFSAEIEGEVPRSRGLGSSVTVRLGVLHGLNELAGRPLAADRLFQLCSELEGHPDNAAPAAFGGFTIARVGAEVVRAEVDPALQFVLLIPGFEVSTPDARQLLPETIDRRRAVESCGNAIRIAAAFLTRRYELLRGSFGDCFHQPHREPLIPFLSKVIAAGEKAGALGGFLSGSGSTICCLVEEQTTGGATANGIAAAMSAASATPGARTIITTADNQGTIVENRRD